MKKVIELTILIVLTSIGSYSLIYTSLTEYIVEQPFYFGFGGILIALALRFWNELLSNYLIAILLILSIFGIVQFSYLNISFGFNYDGSTLFKFYPISLFILLIHLYANSEEVNKLFGTTGNEPESNNQQQNDQEILNWKEKFKDKTDAELTNIINNPTKYTHAPRQAANELLSERNVLYQSTGKNVPEHFSAISISKRTRKILMVRL